jgi:PAS domain S-box-containing protein
MLIAEKFDSVFGKLEKLIELQEVYETVLHSLPSGLVLFDISGKIYFANKSFSNNTGYDSDELTRKHVCDIVPKEFRKTSGWFVEKTPEINTSKTVCLKKKNGTLLEVYATVYPARFQDKSYYLASVRFK